MTAVAEAKKIVLRADMYDYALWLFEQGADLREVIIDEDVPGQTLSKLQSENVIECTGLKVGKRKPGVVRGHIRLTVSKDQLVRGKEYKAREPKDGAEAKPKATRTRTPAAEAPKANVITLPASMLPFNHADVRRYLDATSPNAQREYERDRQTGLTDVEVSKAVKGLKGSALFAKLHELENKYELPFPQFISQTFGSEMVQILGIPEVGQDLPDAK